MNDEPTTEQQETSETVNPELNRLETLRGMRVSIWEGAFATVHSSLTVGAFLTGFALWLGAGDVALSVLTAIPMFTGLVQIVASYFGQQMPRRKPFVAWSALIGRLLWVPILLLPLLIAPKNALIPFLILYAVSFILLNLTVPAWTSWMSDLVPSDNRGRYFARRNTIAGIVGMIIGIPAAWFLDYTTRQNHWEPLGFGILFGLAALGGVFAFFYMLMQPEPPTVETSRTDSMGWRGVLEFYRAPFQDANFRRLMLFNVVFGIGQQIAAPFFLPFALKNLQMGYVWLQILGTISSLSALASMAMWGYLSDKFGNKPILAIGVVGVFTLPIPWIFATQSQPTVTTVLLLINHVLGGLFWAGVGLTQFNLLIRLSPPERTGVYVATMSAVTGLTGGLAPLIGGSLMEVLSKVQFPIAGIVILNFHIVFALSAVLRLAGLLFLRPIYDSSAISARDVLKQLTQADLRSWRNIRRLRKAGDEESRLRATTSLTESRAQIAVSELSQALNDPSLAVREQAARGLGEIADPASLEPLLNAIQDPATGITGQIAEALGRLRDQRALSSLVHIMENLDQHYSARERSQAIEAIGMIGGAEAEEILLNALASMRIPSEEATLFEETIVQALGELGSRRCLPTLLERLQKVRSSSLKRAIIRSLGEIGDESAIPLLRQSLEHEENEAVISMIADSLAKLGDTSAVPLLLDYLSRLKQPIARKQTANAIGILISESDTLYAMLSQDSFARDTSLSKICEEIEKAYKTHFPDADLSPLLSTYIAEDYVECVRFANELMAQIPQNTGVIVPITDGATIPLETALIAILLLRRESKVETIT